MINYTEFIAATLEHKHYLTEEKLYAAFRLFDVNDDGKISAVELKAVLGKENEQYKNKPEKFWKDLIDEADEDGDGYVDYSEFLNLMNKKSH